jgi:hypothetical protein
MYKSATQQPLKRAVVAGYKKYTNGAAFFFINKSKNNLQFFCYEKLFFCNIEKYLLEILFNVKIVIG